MSVREILRRSATRLTACALLGVIALAMSGAAIAAPARTLRGVVARAGTTTPIANAAILGGSAQAVTDVDGYFALAVDAGVVELTVVAPGYRMRTVAVGAGDDDHLRIELVPEAGSEVVRVTGKAPAQAKPLSYGLTVDEIVSLPGAGNDILRAATLLPGVARIPFGFGGLVLRGNSPRDTTVFLDGIEVPIAFHFGGLTSFYPANMLADLQVTSGGYDAGHGRAAGGIVTLTTREPRTDRYRIGGSIGLFDSSIWAEGPWRSGAVLVGIRRSYLDRVVAPFVADDVALPSYWDFQLRTRFGDAATGIRIAPLVFGSIDRVAGGEDSATSLFIRAALPLAIRRGDWTVTLTPWLGLNRLWFSDGEDDSEFVRPFYPAGSRLDAERAVGWGALRGGVEASGGYLDIATFNVGDDDENLGTQGTVSWVDLAVWTELRLDLDDGRFAVKPGLRVEHYGLSRELAIDPRLNLHQQLTERITLRQAIGRFHQPPTPGDLDRRDGNPRLDGSATDQLALGIDALLPDEILASVTAYYNDSRDVGIKVQNPRPGAETLEPNLGGLGPTFELLLEKQLGLAFYRENRGRGRSYGVELLLKRNVGRLFTLLSYTLAKSERTDDPRVSRAWRPFELDQRHDLQLAASYRWTRWRLGARVQFVTGNPYTRETADGTGEPFAARLPVFFELDLRADRTWARSWGDIVLFVDVHNASNRRNVEGREFEESEEDIVGLPVLPFIGLEFRPI